MHTPPPAPSQPRSRPAPLLPAVCVLMLGILGMAADGSDLETDSARLTRFQSMDTDGDGSLSLAEYLANRPGDKGPRGDRAEDRFHELDLNHDGHLSEAELLGRRDNDWAWWLGGLSLVTFVGSLVAVPLIVAKLPDDYFIRDHRPADWFKSPRIRIEWLILKNLLGLLLLTAGLAMLVLPGQGLLTIILGLMLMDFPGKASLLHRFALRPSVLRTINWMRRKAGRPPMLTMPSSRV